MTVQVHKLREHHHIAQLQQVDLVVYTSYLNNAVKIHTNEKKYQVTKM